MTELTCEAKKDTETAPGKGANCAARAGLVIAVACDVLQAAQRDMPLKRRCDVAATIMKVLLSCKREKRGRNIRHKTSTISWRHASCFNMLHIRFRCAAQLGVKQARRQRNSAQ
jgi:hypothetical protein